MLENANTIPLVFKAKAWNLPTDRGSHNKRKNMGSSPTFSGIAHCLRCVKK